MPLCQMQHPPITLSQAVYSSRYYFARNKSLPLRATKTELRRPHDVSQLHHMSGTWKIARGFSLRGKISCGWDSGCRATPLSMNPDLTLLYQFNICFYFLCKFCFWVPGFDIFLSSGANAFVSSLLILRTVIVVPVFM